MNLTGKSRFLFFFKTRISQELNLDKKKSQKIELAEDADGDVDMVLDEEGAKIEEQEKIAKAELEKEFRQYRIKVRINI